MLRESRRDLHQSSLEGLLILRNAVPRRHPRVARRELGLLRNPSLLFRPREHALTILVPAVVELALVLVGPLFHDVVRTMDRTARPVHVEGLVGLKGLMLAQPPDRIVGKILAEVIALLVRARRSDIGGVTNQVGLVLRRFAAEEAIEVIEAVARRPAIEGTRRGCLFGRRVVPFAPRACGIAVVPKHLRGGRAALGHDPGVAVPVVRHLPDLSGPDMMVVPPREERGSSRGAHGRGVESVVGDALLADSVEGRCVDFAAERRRESGSGIVDEDDQDVRRIGMQTARFDAAPVDRLLHRPSGDAG